MRILFTADPEIAVPPVTYGGVQRLVDALLREMKHRGAEAGLVAHPDSSSPADYFRAFPGLKSQDTGDTIQNILCLSKAVKEFQPDIIHSFSRLMFMLPLLPFHAPKLMTYGRYPGARGVRLASRLAGRSLEFTACSNHIRRTGLLGGGTWHTVYNFVELGLLHFQPSVADDAPLVFLSRLDRIKGAHTAIQIAKAAGEKLILAGNRATEGSEAQYFEREIRPHLDKDGIKYIGPVNDQQKNELLGAAKALLVPIEWEEPFGIVFIEALACGTPIISTPRGAVPEIIENHKHGFIIRDVEQAVSAIARLDSLNRADCRKRVEDIFTCKAIANEYERIYRALIGKCGGEA